MNQIKDEIFIKLYQIALQTTKSKETSYDLAQDVAIRVLRNKEKFLELNSLEQMNYLYRACSNEYISQIRKKKEFDLVELEYHHTLENTSYDYGEFLDWMNDNLWVMDRDWITVYMMHDCNYSDVARHFDVSRQQAAVRIKEAIKRAHDIYNNTK